MAKRILVPLDQTPHAEAVLPLVVDIARGGGATVRLLHVAPVPDSVLNAEGEVVSYADQETMRLEVEAMDYLRTVEARLDGSPVECAVRFGEPVEEIVLDAKAFGADLMMFTTSCRRDLRHLVLGSTADQVCRKTATPIVVLRPGIYACA